ncbi:hypothetical protein [Rhodovibrio salinarum]|uniref:Uncharacterized protein n=1 Tax=Rhodovibrio salinarum TaxID=1087 RepID=A0A934QMB1_9PROT|nr:hypothetical protein [Rhodovibrio salinarum]MBK1698979.1 hypothetical protein [Rhodovibrio salinarum]
MIRRVLRRRPGYRSQPLRGAALERHVDLWPFLFAAGLAAGTALAVEPWLQGAVEQLVAAVHAGPTAAPQLAQPLIGPLQ